MSDPSEHEDWTPTPDSRQGDNMTHDRGPAHDESAKPTEQWSRRRFGKTAVGVTPVIATLYGRPLWAAANCMPSGWISGNSSNHHELGDCGGRSPQEWQGGGSEFEANASGNRERIMEIRLDSKHGFPGLHYYVDGSPATVGDALSGVSFDRTGAHERQLIRYGTAAVLNARLEPGYSLYRRGDLVAEAVASAVLHGGYTTPGGDYLDADQVLRFLKNTMDSPSWDT